MTLSFEDFLYNQWYEGLKTQNTQKQNKEKTYKISEHILNEVLYIVWWKSSNDGRIGKVELWETQIKSILDWISINKPQLISQSVEQLAK